MFLPLEVWCCSPEVPGALSLDGKRSGQSPVVAMVAGLKDCLLYVSDRKSGRRLLVDTGAEISVIAATGLKTRISASSQPLLAANGSSIQTYGKHNLNLRLRTGDYRLRTGDYRLRQVIIASEQVIIASNM